MRNEEEIGSATFWELRKNDLDDADTIYITLYYIVIYYNY